MIKAFKANNISVSHDLHEPGLSAVLVFGAGADLNDLRSAQRAGVRVVQRLNGMNWVHRRKFTGVRHFIKAEFGNLKLRAVRELADRVIYQSQFARDWWDREHGSLNKPQAVIHNGVDLTLFSPEPSQRTFEKIQLLMVEAHHGGGYDQGLRSGVDLATRLIGNLDKPVELVVVGDVPAALRQELDLPLITWLGVVDHTKIPEINRSAHLFFSADINAACPNAVLEALACGLPVVAYDTGAMRELVPNSVGRLAPYGSNVWRLEKPDWSALLQAAMEVLSSKVEFNAASRQHAENYFDIRAIAQSYLKILLEE